MPVAHCHCCSIFHCHLRCEVAPNHCNIINVTQGNVRNAMQQTNATIKHTMQLQYPKQSWLIQLSVTIVALNRDNMINETQRNNYQQLSPKQGCLSYMTDVLVLVMVLMGYHHLCYPLPGFLATTLPSRSKKKPTRQGLLLVFF